MKKGPFEWIHATWFGEDGERGQGADKQMAQ